MHLGCGTSHKNNRNDIAQFSSAQVHDYKRHKIPSASLSAEQTLVQTSVFTHRPVSIISSEILHETSLSNHYEDDINHNSISNHVVSEDMFLILMVSNQMRIPCACLLMIIASDEKNCDAKQKCNKLIQYYTNNVLSFSNHSSNPTKMLTFFGEVPMVNDSLLN